MAAPCIRARHLNDQSSGGGMRDHVRLRCWPLEASSPPRAGRASCGRRGIVRRSRPLAAAGRSGRHGRACQGAVVKPVHRLGRHGSSRPRLVSVLVSIHPRPASFTGVHPDRVRAVRGRWRTPVNTGQRCWKACWGQPLRSSNLLCSATLTCDDALGSCSRAALHPEHVSHFLSQLSPRPYAVFRTNRCTGTPR